jgi:mevalonate pyrophosphate decarboxylase
MGSFRDDICGCKDRACIERVSEAMTRWGQAMARKPSMERISEQDSRQIAEITEAMTKCMTAAMMATGSPGQPVAP